MRTARHKEENTYTEIHIQSGSIVLTGDVCVPEDARAIVIFAHGSGSGRMSPRNRQTARIIQAAGMGTLLFDLLSPEEEGIDNLTGQYRFDIDLLARRLVGATEWLDAAGPVREPAIGYFGASTGAAAALTAAALLQSRVGAIVSRGGRPDMAQTPLEMVHVPTLLLVGENDTGVLTLNKAAYQRIRAVKELTVIPGATHLFEEPGTLELASQHAARWFTRFLRAPAGRKSV